MLSEETSSAAKAAAAAAAADDFSLDDDLLADDEELRRLHADRADELRKEAERRAAALRAEASGLGALSRFDEEAGFLSAAANSPRLVAHFAHSDFESCKVVDAHLEVLSRKWLGTRFARVEASDAPFFVTRLKVKVLPAVLCFVEGRCCGRIVGFDELGGSKDFSTRSLERALASKGDVLARRLVGTGKNGEKEEEEEEENRRPEDEDGCDGDGGRRGRGKGFSGGGRRLAPPEHSRRSVRAGGGSGGSRRRRNGSDDDDESGGSDDSRGESETESI